MGCRGVTNLKLPFVQAFADRHGRARYYFRKRGCKRVALPGLPGSAEFMAAYAAAMGAEPAKPPIGASRTMAGTVNATIVGFYGSPSFLALKPTTKSTYSGILEAFRTKNGDKHISTLERRHILNLLAERANTPGAQRNLLRMLKMLLSYAVEHGLRLDNPAANVKLAKPKGDGFHTWSEHEIARFEAHHAIGTRARLALALLLYTAQRRGDVIRMGRQHVREGMLCVKQQKTGTPLEIPVHPALAAVIEATPHQHLTFLVTEYGKPFTPNGFGNWFRGQCDAAGLPHGMRPPWVAQGGMPAIGRSRMLGECHSFDFWAQDAARGCALHEGCRPGPHGEGRHCRDGYGLPCWDRNGNIRCQTA